LKSICAEALEQDFLTKDPARKLKRPKTRKPDETVLEWFQYQAVIDAAKTLRDTLAIKVGSGTAVRPGELFAFRWRSLEALPSGRHAIKVTESIYKSKIRPWAKTEGSEDYVPLPSRLAVELQEWRKLSACSGPDDFIFPNTLPLCSTYRGSTRAAHQTGADSRPETSAGIVRGRRPWPTAGRCTH